MSETVWRKIGNISDIPQRDEIEKLRADVARLRARLDAYHNVLGDSLRDVGELIKQLFEAHQKAFQKKPDLQHEMVQASMRDVEAGIFELVKRQFEELTHALGIVKKGDGGGGEEPPAKRTH